MVDNAKPVEADRLTLAEAIADLGWFSVAFAFVVAGPSILTLLQTTFVDYRFVEALQWIIDGYHRIIAVVGGIFEPLLREPIAWLARLLGLHLELYPHWRPLFVVSMVLVTAVARTTLRDKDQRDAFWAYAVGGGLGAFAGSIAAGLFPLTGEWWAQGLAAALPVMALFLFTTIAFAVIHLITRADELFLKDLLIAVPVSGLIAFGLGALFTLAPGIESGGGLLSVCCVIAGFGAILLIAGLRMNDKVVARAGLTILGGFAVVAAVMGTDLAIKLIQNQA